jgi:hypothetical protein
MAFKFNPFTGTLDVVNTPAASYIDGEVADSSLLPITLGTPAIGDVFLAKAGSGIWLLNRRPAGLYVRTANNGNLNDWYYLSAFQEVNSDANLRVYHDADSSRQLALNVGSIAPATTRTLSAPDRSGRVSVSDYRLLSANANAVTGDKVAADTTSAAWTLTLPATPSNGDTVTVLDYAGTFDTNNLTIARNGSNIESLAEDMTCNVEDAAFTLVYVGASVGWKVVPYFGNKTNFASPDPIGSSVPNTGRFTTLTANNGTLTGASAPVLDLAQTWNASGVTFTGLRVNVTDTASAAASNLAEFQVGGTALAAIRKDGSFRVLGTGDRTLLAHPSFALSAVAGGAWLGLNTTMSITGGVRVLGGTISIGTASSTDFAVIDRDAAHTLALRSTTNAQTFNIYNTFTSTTNHERGFLKWSSNVFQIGTEKGSGGGTARALEFQTDGTSRWQITAAGLLTTVSAPADSGGFFVAGGWMVYRAGTTNHWAIVNGDITHRATGNFQWSGQSDASNFSGDWLRLSRSAGGCLLLSANTSTEHRLQFGGTTSSFPALKRSSATLQVRLADDSAYSVLDAQLRAQGAAPATTGATGTAGDIRYDADYIYVCTATNTWKRAAIATW